MMGQCCCIVRMWRCLCSLLCLSPGVPEPRSCHSHLCLAPRWCFQVYTRNPAIASPCASGIPLPLPSLLPQSFHCNRGLGIHPMCAQCLLRAKFPSTPDSQGHCQTPGCPLWSQEEQQAIGQDHWLDFLLSNPHAESENLK